MIFLQLLDQNECLVTHLKDPLHICLETKVQVYGITFKGCDLGSKQPYFNSAYVVRLPMHFRIVLKIILVRDILYFFIHCSLLA